jgi:predicted phage tail protein
LIRTVHLHGQLGKRFGREHRVDVNSAAEAFHALTVLLPRFKDYTRPRKYVVSIDGGQVLGAEQLPMQLGKARHIHLTPAGMVSGVTEIIVGLTFGLIGLAILGVLKQPKASSASDRESKTASFIFDGPQNVMEQGHPVPLVYGGPIRVGSVVVSSGISTTDATEASVSADPTDPTFGGSYSGYVGSTPGITDSPAGDEWVVAGGIGKLFGGGGGSQRSAQEDPNSLQSQATARVLEAISEGEIVGLVDGMKSIYFDDTPLQNPDGSFNFAGIAVDQRVGLPDQDFIPGFSQTENTNLIDTPVKVSIGPVTRTITDTDVTVARVTIRLPQLYEQKTDTGDMKSSSVSVKISVQVDGGGFTDVTPMNFVGKTTSGYQRSVDVRLPNGASRDIRVTRITADAGSVTLQNETNWDLLTEVVEAKLSYPDTALIGLTVDARQFGGTIPTRSYLIKGIIVEVPTNYDPETRVYTGIWDGTFKRAWTNNPAWVFRDIVVNRRYGLGGRVPPSAIDNWTLYAISQYCDQLVPDGFGGTEPRFTINCCINNPAGAYDVLASIASNFRAFVYWSSGAIKVAQDSPEDPSVLVNRTNVQDGIISYGRVTPLEKRRSVGVVYWNDPDSGFKQVPEIYEEPDLVRRFGRRTGEMVSGFGITSKGQANRAARWLIEDESPGSNTSAVYESGDDHMMVEPGRIAMLVDKMYSADRRGGRVRSSAANSVTIDSPFTLVSGQTYTLRVMLPNGTVRVRTITNSPGSVTVLTLSGAAFSTNPNPGAIWTIESSALANRQFRIRAIETTDAPYKVQALSHDPTKYARVEAERDLSDTPLMMLPVGGLEPPGELAAFEFLLQDGTASIPCVQISWAASTDPRVLFYQAQYKPPDQEWVAFADSADLSRLVRNAQPGDWGFRVRALDSLGRKTAWVETTATLDGQTDTLPEVVAPGLVINSDSFAAKLVWDRPDDYRPLRYEILFHASSTDINDAASLGMTDQLSFTILNPGNYWVRTWFIGFTSPSPTMLDVPDIVFSAGIVPYLTNESAVLPADSNGVVADYSGASGSFVIMSGTTDVSTNFALSTPGGGNPEGLTVGYAGRDFTVTAGLDADEPTATLRIRATGSGIYTGVVLDKIFTLAKAVAGSRPDIKFKRSAAAPATPTGDDPTGWSDSIPNGNDPLWASRADKTFAGTLINVWSQPELIGGQLSPVPYLATDTYYRYQTVFYGGGTYIAIGETTGNAPSGTAQANAQWDVIAAPGGPGSPATPPSGFSATIDLVSGAAINLRTVADAAGYTGLSDATITFRVPSGVTIRGLSGSGIGIDTGTWPTADYTIALTLVVQSGGLVDGGGGTGGGGGGGGRPGIGGGYGGDAIYVRVTLSGGVTINSGGTVRAGGGGGGGGGRRKVGATYSGSYFGGGGGGGGFPNGVGGEGGVDFDGEGDAGSNGTTAGGGAAGLGSSSNPGGAGGGAATAGSTGTNGAGDPSAAPGSGGAAGYAVRKNGFTVSVTNNGTMTGTAA